MCITANNHAPTEEQQGGKVPLAPLTDSSAPTRTLTPMIRSIDYTAVQWDKRRLFRKKREQENREREEVNNGKFYFIC